jgi:hypothetical protein
MEQVQRVRDRKHVAAGVSFANTYYTFLSEIRHFTNQWGHLSSAAQQNLQPIYDHRYIKNNFEIRVGTNLHAIKRPINCAARCSAAGDKNSWDTRLDCASVRLAFAVSSLLLWSITFSPLLSYSRFCRWRPLYFSLLDSWMWMC